MALALASSSSQSISISSGLFDCNAAYTVAGWMYVSSMPGFLAGIFDINCGYNLGDILYFNSSGYLELAALNEPASASQSSLLISSGNWYHIAIVRTDSSNLKCYVDGVDSLNCSLSVTGRGTTAIMMLGAHYYFGGRYLDGRLWGWKAWTRALSQAEVQAERRFALPVSKASLFEAWPLIAGTNRPNGVYKNVDWTEANDPADGDPPPVAWSPVRSFEVFSSGGSGSPIIGEATFAFTVSGTTTGSGLLDADATVSETASGTLTGAGALASSATISVTASGDANGTSAADGDATVTVTASGTATATAAAVTSGTITATASGTLTGRATVTGSGTITVTATLTSGSINGSASFTVTAGPSALSGSAALDADGTVLFSTVSTLTYLYVDEAAIADKVVLQKDFVNTVGSPTAGYQECEVTLGDPEDNNLRIYAPPGGSGSAQQGTVEIDFGAAPGTNLASATVSAAWVDSSKRINAWVEGVSTTTDHNAYEHMIFPGKVSVSTVTAGVSFVLTAHSDHRLSGKFKATWRAF